MQIESLLIEIPKKPELSSESIEKELVNLNINYLRWAIVDVGDNIYTVSVARIKD